MTTNDGVMSKCRLLTEVLREKKLITPQQSEEALSDKSAAAQGLDKTLLKYVSQDELIETASAELGLVFLKEITSDMVDTSLLKKFPPEFLKRCGCLPLSAKDGVVTIATSDPLNNMHSLDEIRAGLGFSAHRVVSAGGARLGHAIDRFYPVEFEAGEEGKADFVDFSGEGQEELLDLANKAPIIKLVNLILSQALRDRASDVHIQPYEKELKVRYRVDGILHDVLSPPLRYHPAIVSRIKVMSNLDIAERRLPQDGRTTIRMEGHQIDIRVSIVPTAYGERAVLRLLDKENLFLGLEELGMSAGNLECMKRMIRLPHGMLLVTGPTGSGKTTSLYASLSVINHPDKNIITIEDPVEYQLSGISQIQVRPKINLTFANGLRSIVRQDPDVIMVGEVRDTETAEIAIHASLTGHLVFSTLHTNDASGAITRLLDMGIEPYLISSSIVLIVAQRLIRLICENCKEEIQPQEESLREVGLDMGSTSGVTFYRGRGCQRCLGTGYSGRTGIYEMLPVGAQIRDLILRRADSEQIRKAAQECGMRCLSRDGTDKLLGGVTTVEEILRVIQT